ncbi:MAG: xanthine dehydrogenase family protein molybdopterin-binding subunit [Dehalococcoidia bacterium]|uniref:xanthine dehydrogenase family protein molybdopterin-binding subunit n=1 Tax=Candidatus Amarobacter glycogenicus TaxID=3140699 RepID=UPI001D9AB006|nr:xanthine dehydrogenase family protein molybdopterin-binding subunit [Dehalococcoidia bacterium]MBK7723724.1 xanthine dehydrogenase family protein molybdopterin-binding subunit [Dehalococcoidia bacterium]
MTTIERPEYKVIGTRPVRPDGVEKVTGRAQYGADVHPAGLIYGRILRSPHAHARILSVDTSEAEKHPGVFAVITAKDFPSAEDKMEDLGETAVNLKDALDNILASTKALYRGHAIAAVAALNGHVAEEALAKIKVQYEVLPPVLNVRDAMREDAPLLNEARRTKTLMTGELSDKPSNIATYNKFAGGDVEAAFAEADAVVEREFTTQMVHQGYIEPHNSTANWNSDDTLTIWTSTQGAFAVRNLTADALKHPIASIKVVPMEIGGGFGGKLPIYLDPVAALLSKRSGRPVKVVMSRTEVFEGSGPTSGVYIKLKAAAKGDRLTAVQATLCYEAGAFPGSPVGAGSMTMLAPYNIGAFELNGYDVVVNKPKVAAYRAPGSAVAAFAIESVIDELCKKQGQDPLQFRLANASKEGTKQVTGISFPRIGAEEALQAAIDSPHWKSPIEGPNRGRGVASGYWFNGGMQSSVVVNVNNDGTLNLVEGSTDIGGSRASLAMQLAETLGVGYETIRPTVVDTDSIGHNDVTGGSRTTFASGLAVFEAGMDIRRQMIARAAKLWGVPEDQVVYESGKLHSLKDSTRELTFKEMAGQSARTGGPIAGKASLLARGAGGAFATHIVDVEVDPDTGKVTILRYTATQDVGTAIHPAYVEGQIQGAVAQGIGWALNEEYFFDDSGRMVNSSYLDYRMPTALDVPMIDTVLVEVPNPGHPYGVRGVGEVPIVPPLGAIANAIADATGHRFTDLPISPRRVVEELNGLA